MAGNVPDIRIRIIVDNTGATATVTETKAAITDLAATAEKAAPALTETATALEGIGTSAADTTAALTGISDASTAAVTATTAVGVAAEESSTRLRDMVRASLELQEAEKAGATTTAEFNAKQAGTAESAAAVAAANTRSQASLQTVSAGLRQTTADMAIYENVMAGRVKSVEEVASAEQALDRLVASGTLTQTKHVAALEALTLAETKLAGGAKGAAVAVGETAKAVGEATKGLKISGGVATEVGVLVGEGVRGNFKRLEGSLVTLANRTGLLKEAFSPLGGAVLGIVAVLGVLATAFIKGAEEEAAFNRALISTGNFAGVTTQDLRNLAGQLAATEGTIGQAKEALQALAASGKFTGDELKSAGKLAEDFGRVTGESAQKAAEEVIKLKEAPLSAVKALDDQYHFLTLSQYAQIEALDKAGAKDEAAEVAQKAFAQAFAGRAAQVEESLGTLQRGWDLVRKNASAAWDAMMHSGAKVTNQSELADVNKQLDGYRSRVEEIRKRRGDTAKVSDQDLASAPEIAGSRDEVNQLLAKKRIDASGALFEQELAATAGHNEQLQKAQKENHDIIQKAKDEGKKDTDAAVERMNAELKQLEDVRKKQNEISPATSAQNNRDIDEAEAAVRSKYAIKPKKGAKGPSDNSKTLAQESIDGKIAALQEAGDKLSEQVDNITDPVQNKIDSKQEALNKSLAAGQKQIADDLREKKITDTQATADTNALAAAYTSASAAVTKYGQGLREVEAAKAAKKQQDASEKVDSFLDRFQKQAQPKNTDDLLAIQLREAQVEFDKLTASMDKNSEAYQAYLTKFQLYSQELTDNTKKNGDDIGQFAVQAAHNIQDQLGKGLTDSLNGSFKSIPANFAKMLEQMMVQLVSSEIAKYLFGDFDKTGALGGVGGGLLTQFSSLIFGGGDKAGGVGSAPTALNSAVGLLGASPFNNVATGSPNAQYGTLGAGNANGQQGGAQSLAGGLLQAGSSLLGLGNNSPATPDGAGKGGAGESALTSAAGLLSSGAKSLGLGSTSLGTNSDTLGTSTGLFSTATNLFGTTTSATLTTAATALTTAAAALTESAVSLSASGAAGGGSGGSSSGGGGFLGLFSAGLKAYGQGGGYATGGYTGDGGKYQEAGVVHAGEFVMTAENTARYRPLLEAMHSGSLGKPHRAKSSYATGGLVQSIATTAQPQSGGGKQTIVNAITHDFVHQAMATAQGEKITMNHITNNSRAVSQAVGVSR